MLFVVCCLLFLVFCFLSAFVIFSLSVCCRQLFASCMPAAVDCKIKYRFPAWQAPEVFSERQPLIFSHYLCLCGSFFSSRLCGIYVRSPSVFLPSAIQKVPGEMPFLHHLLEFVISRPAPGVSLASPAREPHPEGAGWNGLSPPPSRIRYGPTCPRSLSRQPCPGTPSGRCRRKCRLPVTFLFRYVASPHSFGKGGEIPAFPYSFGRDRVKDVVYRPSGEVMRSGRRPAGP